MSGIGNIYADEALWRARLHGARPTEKLTRAQGRAVLTAATEVMDAALAAGGTSFDALYVNVNGASGYFDRSLDAYGQADRPCPPLRHPDPPRAVHEPRLVHLPALPAPARADHEPALALEQHAERRRPASHQQDRERVAQRPVQLGHVVEVHPVDPTRRTSGANTIAAHDEMRLTCSFCSKPASVSRAISSFCRWPTRVA